jgi:hypothetical protein
MARLVGWFSVAAFAAWSVAAVLVSGAEAGGPYLALALPAALIYDVAPHVQAELRRVRRFERTSAPTRRRPGAHLHGSELFRES